MKYNVFDVVTRKSHNNDIEFVISEIDTRSGKIILKGKSVRLIADADESDLVLKEKRTVEEEKKYVLPGHENNTIFGKILHIDGDEIFLKRCMNLYKEYNVPSIGYFIEEKRTPDVIKELIVKHNPDVLVITGHDAIKDGKEYINSKHFLSAIKKVRSVQPNKDSLPIVVGGCQSDFKKLIEYANFASSPGGIYIACLDPAIVAMMIAITSITEFVNVKQAIEQTKGGFNGITGVETRGVARKIY